MKAVETRRWLRREYERLIASGLLAPDERVELIDGEILQMTPQGSAHATAVRLAEDALRLAFGAGYDVRGQLPLALDPDSEPEPDVSVVTGGPRDYRLAHPGSALLVVEVADATVDHDRLRKGSLYARAGIQEFWLINLPDRCLEVYRVPTGEGYQSTQRFLAGDIVSPAAAPAASIPVDDILP